MIILGECNVYIEFLADRMTDDFFFKSGDKASRTELQIISFALAAVERDVILESLVINVCRVSEPCRAIFDLESSRVSFTGLIDLGVDSLICDRLCLLFDLDTRAVPVRIKLVRDVGGDEERYV